MERVEEDRASLAIFAMMTELRKATSVNGSMASAHEGWAVIWEELDEAWDEVRANAPEKCAKEILQTGAMCIRFLMDLYSADELEKMFE